MIPTRILRMKREFERHCVLLFLHVRRGDVTSLIGGTNPAQVLEAFREALVASEYPSAVGRVIRVLAMVGDEERELLHIQLVRRRLTPTGPMQLAWVDVRARADAKGGADT